jgi:hypothetical protein
MVFIHTSYFYPNHLHSPLPGRNSHWLPLSVYDLSVKIHVRYFNKIIYDSFFDGTPEFLMASSTRVVKWFQFLQMLSWQHIFSSFSNSPALKCLLIEFHFNHALIPCCFFTGGFCSGKPVYLVTKQCQLFNNLI